MTITADYTPAPGEDPGSLGPNEFTAGSELTLNCSVQGHSGDLYYNWSVTDTGDCCYIDTSSTTSTLALGRPPLFSHYAGIYTCTVSKSGRPDSTASGNFTVTVVGECMISLPLVMVSDCVREVSLAQVIYLCGSTRNSGCVADGLGL